MQSVQLNKKIDDINSKLENMTNCRIMHYEIHPRVYMAPRRSK